MTFDVAPVVQAPDGISTTTDAFLGGRLNLRQPAEGYRAAIDPVLLAATVPARPGDRIVDLGCGIGTAGLCLLARLPQTQCTGIDFQQGLATLALENARANGLADRYDVLCGSILDVTLLSQVSGADAVIANPPYLPRGKASISAHPIKALANVESDAVLADWVAVAIRLLRSGGSATFIHRADRLPELLALMRDGFGGLVILPIQPKAETPANRVVVRGIKGNKAQATLLPPLVLHAPDGSYTELAEAALRRAATIAM